MQICYCHSKLTLLNQVNFITIYLYIRITHIVLVIVGVSLTYDYYNKVYNTTYITEKEQKKNRNKYSSTYIMCLDH